MDFALALLLIIAGGLWTFCPQWFCRKWAPEERARERKLLALFGPAFIVLGLVLLGLQFVK